MLVTQARGIIFGSSLDWDVDLYFVQNHGAVVCSKNTIDVRVERRLFSRPDSFCRVGGRLWWEIMAVVGRDVCACECASSMQVG